MVANIIKLELVHIKYGWSFLIFITFMSWYFRYSFFSGVGAWDGWHYEVEIADQTLLLDEPHKQNVSTDTSTQLLMVKDLKYNTMYSFRARAYSNSGYGPWSISFNGTTLQNSKFSFFHRITSCNEKKT